MVFLGSPNYSSGRGGVAVQFVVLHTMVGTVADCNAVFQNPATQLSAHYGVGQDGSVVEWVNENDTAYHAGTFPANQASVGIEHEDKGQPNSPRPDALYATSGALVAEICARHGIPVRRGDYASGLSGCVDHRTIVATGCPDALDTDRIIQEAQGMTQVEFDALVTGNGTLQGMVKVLNQFYYALGIVPNPDVTKTTSKVLEDILAKTPVVAGTFTVSGTVSGGGTVS